MLHILLLLLKIIGCLILILLGLIVMLLCVVLFVPVRYRLTAGKYDALTVEGEATWLFRLIGCFFLLDTAGEEGQRVHFGLRIAWLHLYDNLHPRQKRIKKRRLRKTRTKADKAEEMAEAPEIYQVPEMHQTSLSQVEIDVEHGGEAIRKPEKELTDGTKETFRDESQDEPEEAFRTEFRDDPDIESRDEAGDGFLRRLWMKMVRLMKGLLHLPLAVLHWMTGIPGKLSDISERLNAAADKLAGLREKKNRILAIYRDEKNHRWFTKFFRRLKRLVIRLLPHIDRLTWHFGFDDPATTGQVLGYLSILYPICRERMELKPEFDQTVMEGGISLHGRIRLCWLAVFAISSFLNRQFFRIVKQVKNL